jgi:hypothetical protein
MLRLLLCDVLACILASVSAAAMPSTQPASAARPTWPERRIISGLVEDADGHRVAGAIVFILDAETGIPYSNITDHPFTDPKVAGEPALITHVATGNDGRFMIRGVFPGMYRLVAQSWEGVASVKDLADTHSDTTTLRGVIEDILVTDDHDPPYLSMKPAGTATIHVTFDREDSAVLVSTEPLSGDPLLGPQGGFLKNVVRPGA